MMQKSSPKGLVHFTGPSGSPHPKAPNGEYFSELGLTVGRMMCWSQFAASALVVLAGIGGNTLGFVHGFRDFLPMKLMRGRKLLV